MLMVSASDERRASLPVMPMRRVNDTASGSSAGSRVGPSIGPGMCAAREATTSWERL
ncbi:Uncharacterised protein [Mycobacteroides abscessus subsp. massiliense]|nr:Uncharacterised protein [Mycobacteroides abscessus subsp. massiliense]